LGTLVLEEPAKETARSIKDVEARILIGGQKINCRIVDGEVRRFDDGVVVRLLVVTLPSVVLLENISGNIFGRIAFIRKEVGKTATSDKRVSADEMIVDIGLAPTTFLNVIDPSWSSLGDGNP
jgi:hypothetical protein